MNTLKTLLKVLVALALLTIGWAWSGMYDVAADRPHTRPVAWLLEVLRERSIAVRASDIDVPPLEDEALIRSGAGNYDAMCSGCHLAPGMAATELSRGLYPAPPDLARHGIEDAAEAFWAIKHGIKASGMPAWGKSMDDSSIWGMVALLRQLPQMTPEQYRALVASSEGHSHGGGENGHDHGHDAGEPTADGHPDEPAAEPSPHRHDHDEDHDHGSDASAATTPEEVARSLHAALASGDTAMIEALLDPQVLILESGGAERSRAEYAAHHMRSDMAFLKDAEYTLLHRTGDEAGDLAWVASEARIAAQSRGQPVDLASAETLVLKKLAGGWRIVHVHWSSRPIRLSSTPSKEHES